MRAMNPEEHRSLAEMATELPPFLLDVRDGEAPILDELTTLGFVRRTIEYEGETQYKVWRITDSGRRALRIHAVWMASVYA